MLCLKKGKKIRPMPRKAHEFRDFRGYLNWSYTPNRNRKPIDFKGLAVLFASTAPLNLFAHFAVTPTDTNVSAACIVRAFGYLMLRECGFLTLFHALDTND